MGAPICRRLLRLVRGCSWSGQETDGETSRTACCWDARSLSMPLALGDRVLVNPGQGVVPALTYMALFSFQPLSSM